jgi:hypothetical protein
VEGDSVYIPSNFYIVLDVSPPRLAALFVEGTLEFDRTMEEVHLACSYLFVHKGGHLIVGTEADPFPGRSATITLHGDMESSELPIYGAKNIALR